MSRSFNATTDKVLGWTVTPPTTGTICWWWFVGSAYNDGNEHDAFDQRTGASDLLTFSKYLDNNFYGGWVVGGVDRRATGSASFFNAAAWNSCVLTWNSSSGATKFYCNDVKQGTDGSGLSASDLTGATFTIGNVTGGGVNSDGAQAEFAMYNVEWTANDVHAFHQGFCPRLIRPAGLVRYIDFVRDPQERILGTTLAVTGTTVQNHRAVIYPRRKPIIPFFAAAAPPTFLQPRLSLMGAGH